MKKLLTLKYISKSFYPTFLSKKEIFNLKIEDLTFHSGEIIGVIGRNGSGKSTLLKLVAGALFPDKGEIKKYSSYVSLINITDGLDENLNAYENIKHNSIFYGLERTLKKDEIKKIIEYSEIKEFAKNKIATYSDGMKLKLGFAISVFINADIFIMDEHFYVGDTAFFEKSILEFEKVTKKGGLIILANHNLEMLGRECTHIIWLEDGLVKMFGQPKKVINSYKKSLEKVSN